MKSAAIGKTVAVIGALSRIKNDDGSIDADTIIWGGGGGGEIRYGCAMNLARDSRQAAISVLLVCAAVCVTL